MGELSHGLRSPLGALVNLAAILEEDYAPELDVPGRELLRRITASADRALALLEVFSAGEGVPGRQGAPAPAPATVPGSPDGAHTASPPGLDAALEAAFEGRHGSPTPASMPASTIASAPASAPAEVFLVEDDPEAVSVALQALGRLGIGERVAVARDGLEALAGLRLAAREGRLPRVVFLDLQMPRLDGWGILEALRSDMHTRHLPVVVVSASRRAADIRRAYHLGANSYLVKGGRASAGAPAAAGRGPGEDERPGAGPRAGPGEILAAAARYWLEHNEGCP